MFVLGLLSVASMPRVKTKCQKRPRAIFHAAFGEIFANFAASGKISTKDTFTISTKSTNDSFTIRDAPKKKTGKCGNFEKTGGGGVYPNPTSIFYCF